MQFGRQQEISKKFIRLLVAMSMLIACFSQGEGVCAAEPEEYKVKVAFIYNFAKFIEWPPGSFPGLSTDMIMCILGEDPFGGTLSAIESKMVGERSLTVRWYRKIEDCQGCNVLFICRSEKDRLDQLLRAVKGVGILTISDIPDFTRIGGIIGFTTTNGKIRFEINLTSARSSQLEISSKLLKLAETVREDR